MSASKSSAEVHSRPVAAVGWNIQKIPVAPDRVLPARIYGQRSGAGPTPLVLHFHGGAFVGGTLDSGAQVAGLLAQAGSVVVSLDYPLAPAHPFPQAAEAGHAALDWMHRNRRRLGGDGAVLLVAGEEAGGNLAAAVSLMARDRHRPPLAGQILLSPMLDPCLGTASLREADIDVRECPWTSGWASYLPRVADACHPYAAPAICLRLAQVPATLVITAGDDPMRDEALAFAGRLRGAGVAVDQVVVEEATGWPQSFMQNTPADVAWAEGLRRHVGQFITACQDRATSQTRQPPLV
jgi:acetyl esterase/lipase